MIKTLDELRKMADEDLIGGICIDTSVFVHYGLNLETSWFGRLKQFNHEGRPKIYFPDVLRSEYIKKMAESFQTLKSSCNTLVKSAKKLQIDLDQWASGIFSIDSYEFANSRFSKFASQVGVIDLPCADNVTAVFNRYFLSKPPFERNEGKKNEFPDAFILQTLEDFCKFKGSVFLLISEDSGWIEFCKSSNNLICVQSISDALSCFQLESALHIQDVFNRDFEKDTNTFLMEQIKALFKDELENVSFTLSAVPPDGVLLDAHFLAVSIQSLCVQPEEGDLFRVADLEVSDRINVYLQCFLKAELNIEFDVAFSVYNSTEREQYVLDSRRLFIKREEVFESMINISSPPIFDNLPKGMRVVDLGLDDNYVRVDVGRIDLGEDFDSDSY